MSTPVDVPEPATPFGYGTWSRLLTFVVTAEGKVDYEITANVDVICLAGYMRLLSRPGSRGPSPSTC